MNTQPIASVVAIVLLVSSSVRAENTQAAQSLIDAYGSIAKQFQANDVNALRDHLTDDFRLIDYEGQSSTKDSLLDAIRDGIIVFSQCEMGLVPTKDLGETGIVQGPVRMKLKYGRTKQTDIQGRFALTAVLVKQDGKWKLTTIHLTKTKAAGE